MEHITQLISAYGVLILLPIMIVEGPIITVIAAFLASLGVISVVLVYALALLGNVIGDMVYYAIGRLGRETFIRKYGKYIGLTESAVEQVEIHYKNHLLKTILVAKVTEAPVVPALVAAGVARTDARQFLLLVIALEIPKVFIIVLVGYYFGKFYTTLGKYFENTVLALGLTTGLLVVLFIIYKKIKRKNV